MGETQSSVESTHLLIPDFTVRQGGEICTQGWLNGCLLGKSLLKGQRWRRWEAPQKPETGENDVCNPLPHPCVHFLIFFNPSYSANCSQQHPSPKAFPQTTRWYFGMLHKHQRGLFLKQAHAPTAIPDTHHELGMPDPASSPKPFRMM